MNAMGSVSRLSKIPTLLPEDTNQPCVDHLIGSPKALACEEFASKTWVTYPEIPALKSSNVEFIRGSVSSIDPQGKIAAVTHPGASTPTEEPYDFFIASSGLRRAFPTVPQSLEKREFLQEARDHQSKIENARDGVVVVGGGNTKPNPFIMTGLTRV
jgi:NADH dehydrogenase FAD-containing subunit